MDALLFVQNIKTYCKAMGVAPTTACRESGAGERFLSNVEQGSTPSIAKVQKLAAYLGITTSELLGEKKDGPTTVSDDASKPDWLVRFNGLDPDDQQEVIAIIEMKATRKKKP